MCQNTFYSILTSRTGSGYEEKVLETAVGMDFYSRQASSNPFFLKYLQAKEAQGDTTGKNYDVEWWKYYTIKHALMPSTPCIYSKLDAADIGTTQTWIYDGVEANMSHVEVSICTPEEVKQSGIRDVSLRYPSTE